MEQWTVKLIPQNFSNRGISISGCQLELLDFIEKSPLMTAIKDLSRVRKYKITHRSYARDPVSCIGDSFLMNASDLLNMDFTSDDLNTYVQSFLTEDGCCYESASNTVSKIALQNGTECTITRDFTPLSVNETTLLHISAVTLKHPPQQPPSCPFCLRSIRTVNKDDFVMPGRNKRISPSKTLTDINICSEDDTFILPAIQGNGNVHQRNFLNCSKESDVETSRSPAVIMDSEEAIFQSSYDNLFNDILSSSSSGNCTESGHSTLTKKSTRVVESNRVSQMPLEPPPRKQQRVSDYTHDVTTENQELDNTSQVSTSVTSIPTITPSIQREGCINKVIAEFTMLNVERNQSINSVEHQNSCNPGVMRLPTDDLCSRETVQDNRKKQEHTLESHLNASKKNSLNSDFDSVSRLSRRRNAASACAWPSFHNEGTPFFNRRTGLPLQSSPVPLKRSTSGKFDFDSSFSRLKTSRSSICMVYNHNLRSSSEIADSYVKGNQSVEKTSELKNIKSVSGVNNTVPVNIITSTVDSTDSNDSCGTKNGSSNNNNDSNNNNNNKPNQSVSFRRRPSSLRFTPQHQDQSAEAAFERGGSSRLTVAARRRNYPGEMDSIELSCSAPPSGSRGFQISTSLTDRLANTMACTPVPHGSSQHLLVNFEESMLNGRIHPVGQVEGFSLELGASGSFYPNHVRLPMKAYFFDLSDDNAPSPYLGYADLRQLPSNKGYHIPKKGSIQLTLFNPTGLVVKMFVIVYDLDDMPPNCQTFLRQRTVYMPIQQNQYPMSEPTTVSSLSPTSLSTPSTCQHHHNSYNRAYNPVRHQYTRTSTDYLTPATHPTTTTTAASTFANASTDLFWSSTPHKSLTEPNTPLFSSSPSCSCSSISSVCSSSPYGSQSAVYPGTPNSRNELPAYLRYLVHLRFHTTRSGKLYLHTDLRLIFSRDKFEFDPRVATYELRSFVDAPSNPRYSPKKWSTRHTSTKHHRKTMNTSAS
nr:unnamed protein product [Trichobilharzia regenti]